MPNCAPRAALFAGATTGTGDPADCSGAVWVKAFLKGHGTVASGTIVIEEADYFGAGPGGVTPNPVWPGAWSAIGSPINCSDAASGAQKTYLLPLGPYSTVRGRFTADISDGGNVDLELILLGP